MVPHHDPARAQVLFHASRGDIDRPTIAGRVPGENHPNSGLGIFCATRPCEYIGMFGPWVHEIQVRPNLRRMRLDIGQLARMGRLRDRDWFARHGQELAAQFDVIDLVEINGTVEQVIILRDDAIACSRKIPVDEFAAIMVPDPGSTRTQRTPRAPRG